MTPEEFHSLRMEVKILIAGLDLDRRGGRLLLLKELSKRLGEEINIKSLCMALTGYRNGSKYATILQAIKDILANGDFIHIIKSQHN